MFSMLNRALSWAITSFGNKFCLKMGSRLIKAFSNRFYVKFVRLENGLLGMQSARGAQRDSGQWLPDYAASPNHACLKKRHWGPRLSILCLLGDQRGRARVPSVRPCPPTEKRNFRPKGDGRSGLRGPLLPEKGLTFWGYLTLKRAILS